MERASKGYRTGDFSVNERLKSFRHAFRGIATLVRFEQNAWIHMTLLVIVIVAGLLFKISLTDWIAIIVVSGLVLASECFNTSIEYLSDTITTQTNENIMKAKDVAAAGVMISALAALITGLIIFIPEILKLLRR